MCKHYLIKNEPSIFKGCNFATTIRYVLVNRGFKLIFTPQGEHYLALFRKECSNPPCTSSEVFSNILKKMTMTSWSIFYILKGMEVKLQRTKEGNARLTRVPKLPHFRSRYRFKGTLWIGHCPLCMEGHFILKSKTTSNFNFI